MTSTLSIEPMSKIERNVQESIWHAVRLAGTAPDYPGALETVRVLSWFIHELPMILERFPADANDKRTQQGMNPDAYWPNKLTKFAHRAAFMTLDSPEGQQAVFELMATNIGWCASIWRLSGPASTSHPVDPQDATFSRVKDD